MTEDAQFKLRLPQDLKEFIEAEAKANYRTINGEVLYRLEQSRSQNSGTNQSSIKVIHFEDGKKRLVFGKLVNVLGVDYSQSLRRLQKDIELSLYALRQSSLLQKLAFFNKDVRVHRGNNHIDVVDNGEGSLGWLRIEDHYISDED